MFSEEFSLKSKKALVAGDSQYWSKYVAAALAEAGADIAVAAKNSPKLKEVAGEVRHLGRKAIAIPTDLTKSSQVERMVEQAVGELGNIDILVNATDLEFAKPLLEVSKSEWNKVMEANLTSVFLCCQAVGKQMVKNKKGRIINVISCLAERGLPNSAPYCVAMGGVLQLTRALALEWGREGIRVNAIGTGWFSETEKLGVPGEERLLRYLPLRRYGHPREIGSLVVYLASDAADYVSGQFLYVDGALMARD